MTESPKFRWGLVAGVFLLAVALWHPLSHLIYSIRLASAMQAVASGATGQELAVKQLKVRHKGVAQDYEALVYYPDRLVPTQALILAAGVSELGCYHPRLVGFSRFLADRGFLVVTPDIRAFREFRIAAEPIAEMLFWYNQVSSLERGQSVKKTGLAGISFSGTLALMAAARPDVRDSVAFVAAIGPYYNLVRCTKEWFTAQPVTGNTEYYPTKFYARWVVMRAALDMLSSSSDRSFLNTVLESLLLQRKVPSEIPELTPEGNRWYRLATMHESELDSQVAQEIEEHLVQCLYRQLDPENALNDVRCPVFLIHGAFDDLIPPRESLELHQRLERSHLLISPFLTHTHPSDKTLSLWQKASAVFDTLNFCFQFSRIVE